MKLNPIYQNELKLKARTKQMIFVILGYNLLLAFFGLFAFYISFYYEGGYKGIIQYENILNVYAVIVALEFGLLLLIIPAVTATAIAGEREKQTLEILLTTKISPLKIIVGKLGASISFMILLGITSLPVLSLIFSIGGITFWDLLEVVLLILATGIYVGSIGLLFSTLYKKSNVATIFSYGAVAFLVIGTLGVVWGVFRIHEMSGMELQGINEIYPEKPDVGNWLLLFLINPAVTCISMIEKHTGTGVGLQGVLGKFGVMEGWMTEYWFFVSILIQLGIGAVCLIISSKLLAPIKKK